MCVDPANCGGYCPECQAQKGKQKMTLLEEMARMHWNITHHYAWDDLPQFTKDGAIEVMRPVVHALMNWWGHDEYCRLNEGTYKSSCDCRIASLTAMLEET